MESNQCAKDAANGNQVFFHFLPGPLHPTHVTWSGVSVHGHYNHVNGCQIQQLRSLNIWNQPPDREPQWHAVPISKGSWRDGSIGQFPSCLPFWSLARRPLPSHPNTRYCLEIHVTLTEETGVVPPPSHTWIAPLVEDVLCYARTGFTKAMVTGPGRAVLFYGRHSLGEGLSPDEFRDATFVLTGAGTCVVKPAYLAADILTIQEGWSEIPRL